MAISSRISGDIRSPALWAPGVPPGWQVQRASRFGAAVAGGDAAGFQIARWAAQYVPTSVSHSAARYGVGSLRPGVAVVRRGLAASWIRLRANSGRAVLRRLDALLHDWFRFSLCGRLASAGCWAGLSALPFFARIHPMAVSACYLTILP